MTLTLRHGALALGSFAALCAFTMWSPFHARAAESSFTDAQKAEMGDVIKNYLLENPQVIFEAADKYKAQQEAETIKKAETSIKDNIEYLTRADAPSTGNPKGDVTVVEFFDYNCGYCKKALPDIHNLSKSDANVRVVFKEMPIVGPTSRTAALWALAANKQGKYFEFHVAVMDHKGPKEDAEMEKLAKDLGLDVEKMKKDIESQDIKNELAKDMTVAGEIGVQGTPAFIVGTTFIPGYVGEEGLKQAIADVRSKAKGGEEPAKPDAPKKDG